MGRADHRYCAYYCEENIWQLLAESELRPDDSCEVWLISNAAKSVAMWGQRASSSAQSAVVWDYHVVLAREDTERSWEVWDFDHRGPFVRPALDWLDASFPTQVREAFVPHFRCIEATDYLREFRSDRRHMRSADDPDQWSAPPPSWPAIGVDGDHASNLLTWLDLEGPGPGRWQDLRGLRARLDA